MVIRVKGFFNGIMGIWDEVPEAARYWVHLAIGVCVRKDGHWQNWDYKEIALVEVDRKMKYCSFPNLANVHYDNYGTKTDYYMWVEAEDKNGNIINKSDYVVGMTYIIDNEGYYGTSGSK